MSEELETLPRHPFDRCFEMDGSRHCYRCGQTWHSRNGVWESFSEICVENVPEIEKIKRQREQFRKQVVDLQAKLARYDAAVKVVEAVREYFSSNGYAESSSTYDQLKHCLSAYDQAGKDGA